MVRVRGGQTPQWPDGRGLPAQATGGSHMGTRRRLALLALAVAIAVLVMAVPAQAATVKSGSSQMTIGPAYVTELAKLHVTWRPSRRRRW